MASAEQRSGSDWLKHARTDSPTVPESEGLGGCTSGQGVVFTRRGSGTVGATRRLWTGAGYMAALDGRCLGGADNLPVIVRPPGPGTGVTVGAFASA